MAGVTLVGDRERESAAAALRRQYLHGRLSLDQLAQRVEFALHARDTDELRAALRGLPPLWRDGAEIRRLGSVARRAVILALLWSVWLLVSIVLLVSFSLTALVHGVSTGDAIGFAGAWVVATALAVRASRRA
jgi:hypothetical protein